MEELVARHRKEQRDLQSQITQKKKSASKKTRKTVNDECAKLESDLKARQAQEVRSAKDDGQDQASKLHNADTSEDLLNDFAETFPTQVTLDRDPHHARDANEDGDIEVSQERKPNRQKARMARRAAEQEAVAVQAAREAAEIPDLKKEERTKLVEQIQKYNLVEIPVAANGHCMYLAVADQMNQMKLPIRSDDSKADKDIGDFKIIRDAAADYISNHPREFEPFLEEPVQDYIHKIRDTAEWGGQLELLALAKTFKLNVNVLQAEGRPERIEGGECPETPEVWLAYYRHGFGLGEHYNSLRQKAQRSGAG